MCTTIFFRTNRMCCPFSTNVTFIISTCVRLTGWQICYQDQTHQHNHRLFHDIPYFHFQIPFSPQFPRITDIGYYHNTSFSGNIQVESETWVLWLPITTSGMWWKSGASRNMPLSTTMESVLHKSHAWSETKVSVPIQLMFSAKFFIARFQISWNLRMIPKSPIYKKAQICCSAFTQKNPMSPPDGVGMGFFACRGCFLIESMLYSVQQIGIWKP